MCIRDSYKIDTFQETYFVIDSFKQLFDATEPDFTPYYETLRSRRDLAANEVIAEDELVKA